MHGQITISYPEMLAFSLKMRNQEFEREMKVTSYFSTTERDLESDFYNA